MSTADGFNRFPNFTVDLLASILDNYNRLAQQEGWKWKSSKYKKNRASIVNAEFRALFGDSLSNLENWQRLCRAVTVEEIPDTITQCKKVLQTVQVNIFDLIDAARSGSVAKTFETSQQLAVYTRNNHKVFGRNDAKGNKLLSFMLRHLHDCQAVGVGGVGGRPKC